MSSSLCVLAFALPRPDAREVDARLESTDRHMRTLFMGPITREVASDGQTGLAAWIPDDRKIDWPLFVGREDAAIAWLHVPSAASVEPDAWKLADAVLSGSLDPSQLAVPFGLLRWRPGSIEVVNDVLGAVRLFEFTFAGGLRVWTTRMGAANVFAGVEPRRSSDAWSGMATIGWAPAGVTQLDGGHQLPAGSRVTATARPDGIAVVEERYFPGWYVAARDANPPSLAAQVAGIRAVIAASTRWPRPVVADLSGGKDSRTIAAVGIASGIVGSVRTIATDHGEVETARELVRLLDDGHDVEHRITPPATSSGDTTGSLLTRLLSRHHASDGRYLAASAFAERPFAGYTSPARARLNGLGGEVLNGGALWVGSWRDRMLNAPPNAALDRLAGFVRSGRGVSDEARERAHALLASHLGWVDDVGAATAGAILDLIYMCDRVPHWVNIFGAPDTLCPFLAPELLATATHSVGTPQDDAAFHGALLQMSLPAWADVPFYKPVGITRRAAPLAWQGPDWPEIRRLVNESADFCDRWAPDQIQAALGRIEAGEASKPEHVMIGRFLWDLTFDDHLARLGRECAMTRDAVNSAMSVER